MKIGNYILNEKQIASLNRVAERWEVSIEELLKSASPEIGNPDSACLMINPKGQIWLGIERDGYTHS